MLTAEKGLDFDFSATTGVNPDVPIARIDIPVRGMSPSSNKKSPESALKGLRGVQRAFFNPTTRRLSVWYRTRETGAARIYRAAKEAGFDTGTHSLRLRIKGI